MDKYLAIRLGKPLATKIEGRIPFLDLQFFYHHRFIKQLKGGDENWSKDWDENKNATLMEVSKTGLMDFETVRRDLEYELFSIRNEQGDLFFNEDLLRNIKLVCYDAGQDISFEEDPLLRVRAVQDRDLQATSSQILSFCKTSIAEFYKRFREMSDLIIAQCLSETITALHLSANPHNLIQNTAGKSSLQYFNDFQLFLRRAMNSPEYQKFIAYPPEAKDKTAHFLMRLCHSLSFAFFDRVGGVKQETIGLIHRCMRKGEEKEKKPIKGDTIWNQLMVDDEKFRTLLSKFPNGPLFKILDQIRIDQPELMSFDPILQANLPQKMCGISGAGRSINVIRMPCPTRQALINKATVVEEFRGFLRCYATNSKKHFLINLQDRSSWQEFARANCMEMLQKNAEFYGQLIVATLPKSSDFYYQYGELINQNAADLFIAEFQKALSEPQEAGFFFPPQLLAVEMNKFYRRACVFIHKEFFEGKKTLTRRNREDFIEIFYQLAILKWIEDLEPDSISFTCKDAVDTGAAALALFYGFMQIINRDLSSNIDNLRYLFYMPAFFIRERAIDPERLGRALSALEHLDKSVQENPDILKHMESLYNPKFLKQ